MSNNSAPCFNRIKLVVIPSHIEFPWFYNIGVLKNFAKFGGKHLCLSLRRSEAWNFIKKRLRYSCFLVWNFNIFFIEHFRWLLLDICVNAPRQSEWVIPRFDWSRSTEPCNLLKILLFALELLHEVFQQNFNPRRFTKLDDFCIPSLNSVKGSS